MAEPRTPSFEEFNAGVREAGIPASLDQIRSAYKRNFDRAPVFTSGPTLPDFRERARQAVPGATDEQIDSAYERNYNTLPWYQDALRGIKTGLGHLPLTVGGMIDAHADTPKMRGFGQQLIDYGRGVQQANRPETAVGQQWYDEDTGEYNWDAVLRGDWLASALGQGAASIALPFAAGAGAMAAGAPLAAALPLGLALGAPQEGFGGTYFDQLDAGVSREQAREDAWKMTGATAALGALPLGRMLSPVTRKWGGKAATGIAEAATELAEEPAEALITGEDPLTATKRGLPVIAPAFLLGAGLQRSALPTREERSEAIRSDLEGLATDEGPVDEAAPTEGQGWSVILGPDGRKMPASTSGQTSTVVDPQGNPIPEAPTPFVPTEEQTAAAQKRAESVQAQIDPIIKKWKGLSVAVVPQFVTGMPQETWNELMDSVGPERAINARGLRKGNEIFLNAEMLTTPADVEKTLAHEAVGHFGLETMLGEKKFSKVRKQVLDLIERDADIKRIAEEVRRDYAPAIAQFGEDQVLVQEVIAKYAESRPFKKNNAFERLLVWIREWLRESGMKTKFSRGDLNGLLANAARSLTQERVQAETTGPVQPQTVFHGSGAKFDQFDRSYIGTGQGMQVYGKGFYFSKSPEAAGQFITGMPRFYEELADLSNQAEAAGDMELSSIYEEAIMYGEPKLFAQAMQGRGDAFSAAKVAEVQNNLTDLHRRYSGEHTYTVDIPDQIIDNMLDYQAPFNKQPEAVKNFVRDEYLGPGSGAQRFDTGGDLLEQLEAQVGAEEASRILAANKIPGVKVGVREVSGSQRGQDVPGGEEFYVLFNPEDISQVMRDGQVTYPDVAPSVQAALSPTVQPATAPTAQVDVADGKYRIAGIRPNEAAPIQFMADLFENNIRSQRGATQDQNQLQFDAMQRFLQNPTEETRALLERTATDRQNAEDLALSGQLVMNTYKEMIDAVNVAANDRTEANAATAMSLASKFGVLMAPHLGQRTEAGRQLRALQTQAKEFAEASKVLEAIPSAVMDKLGSGTMGNFESAMAFVDQIQKAQNNASEVSSNIEKVYTPGLWDKFYEYWINSILSGPDTHAVNNISNMAFQLLENVSRTAAALTPMKGSPTLRQMAARWSGSISGLSAGAKLFKNALVTGEPQLGGATMLEHREAIEGKLGSIVRTPGRLLLAEDEFWKAIGYYGTASELAMRKAEAEGNSWQETKGIYDQIMGRLQDHPEIVEEAKTEAARMTFTTPMGPNTRALKRFLRQSKIGEFVVPFLRTPTNIVREAVRFTPGAGFMMQKVRDDLAGKNGADAKAIQMGRWLVGTGVYLAVALATDDGEMSGNGPEDDNEKRLLMAQGWQPYSIKVGDKWIKYNRFEPVGMLLGVAADATEIAKYSTGPETDKLGSMIMGSLMSNLGDKTFLRGIFDFGEAMTDPDRYASQYIGRLAGSFAMPNIVAQPTWKADPFLREARTIVDQVRARIPGERQKLQEVLDVAGEPIENITSPIPGVPTKVSQQQNQPLVSALLDLGLFKGKPGRSIMGVELSGEDYRKYAEVMGKARFQHLTPMVQSPQFRGLMQQNPEMARYYLNKAWNDIGSAVRQRFLWENPQVVTAVRDYRQSAKAISSSYLR